MGKKKTKAAEPTKPKQPDPVIEQIEVRYNFTIEEIGEIARKMSAANQRVQEFEERKKQQAADLKAQIDLAQAEVNSLAWKVSNGYEMRMTDCVVTFDPKNESKDYHVKRTGEFVTRRAMDRRDFELSLPFEKLKEAAATEQAENAGKVNVGEALDEARAAANGEPEMRKPTEWAEADGIVILDQDGWRGRYQKDFETPITRAEFDSRKAVSTIMGEAPETQKPAEEAVPV